MKNAFNLIIRIRKLTIDIPITIVTATIYRLQFVDAVSLRKYKYNMSPNKFVEIPSTLGRYVYQSNRRR